MNFQILAPPLPRRTLSVAVIHLGPHIFFFVKVGTECLIRQDLSGCGIRCLIYMFINVCPMFLLLLWAATGPSLPYPVLGPEGIIQASWKQRDIRSVESLLILSPIDSTCNNLQLLYQICHLAYLIVEPTALVFYYYI